MTAQQKDAHARLLVTLPVRTYLGVGMPPKQSRPGRKWKPPLRESILRQMKVLEKKGFSRVEIARKLKCSKSSVTYKLGLKARK